MLRSGYRGVCAGISTALRHRRFLEVSASNRSISLLNGSDHWQNKCSSVGGSDVVPSLSSSFCFHHHQRFPSMLLLWQLRYKHSGRMGHKLDTLEELAHRPEREAAQERRKKKKERKAVKKNKKGNDESDETSNSGATAAAAANELEVEEDDDFWLDEGSNEEEDDNNMDEDDVEPSLPDPKQVEERMVAVISRFQESLKTIRGAEPTPEMFDDVQVNAYGSMTPLKAVGQVVIASPTLAQITCFDPAVAMDVQKAIQLTLELNPQMEEGGMLRVPLPRVSMEVREQTAKQLQKKVESCKHRLRKVRRKAMDVVKKGKDGKIPGISKDDAFANGKEIEAVTESSMEALKKIVDEKMNSIMAV